MSEAQDNLLQAARQVVQCWESGDLAAAVRDLNAVIGECEQEQTEGAGSDQIESVTGRE